jgi:hypothetical protein
MLLTVAPSIRLSREQPSSCARPPNLLELDFRWDEKADPLYAVPYGLQKSYGLSKAQEVGAKRGAFKKKGGALLVQVRSRELLKSVVEDPILKKSVRGLEGREERSHL